MSATGRRFTRGRIVPALLAAALLVGCGWLVAARISGRQAVDLAAFGNGGPAVPAQGAYLGATVWPSAYDQQSRIDTARDFERELGTPLAIAHVYVTWGSPLATASTTSFARAGQRLLVSWATTDTARIAAGDDDAAIRKMAGEVADFGRPIFLQPRWEMDRPNLASVVHSPQDFVAAWDRIRRIFAEQHVRNVSWVWCPTAQGFATGTAPKYYPGDDEVDWLCADAYPLAPFVAGSYEPLSQLLTPFMTWAATHRRPVMIGEFGVPVSYGEQRASWLEQAARYVRATDQIKALVYYDGPYERADPRVDYWLQDDPAAMAAFAAIAREPYFSGALR